MGIQGLGFRLPAEEGVALGRTRSCAVGAIECAVGFALHSHPPGEAEDMRFVSLCSKVKKEEIFKRNQLVSLESPFCFFLAIQKEGPPGRAIQPTGQQGL